MAKKNILLILTDQQSSTMMGCAGNPYLKTPAMDSLAASGVRFNRAYATDPVCVPSRFSLMTGRYPSEIGQRSNVWRKGECLPEKIMSAGLGYAVRSAGYEVAYGGKEHFPGADAESLGFRYICSNERDELARACGDYLKQPHDKPFFLVASFINPHDICYMAITNLLSGSKLEKYTSHKAEVDTMTEATRNPEGVEDDEFFAKYAPPLPSNHEPQEDEPEAVLDLLDQREFRRKARSSWDEFEWRRHRWAYHRLTENVDKQIDHVLGTLRESGLEEDTVVIFTSDHGDHDSSHKLEHKTLLYNEATRIPMIIKDPDCIDKGSVSEYLICNGLDIYPTVCDYADAEVPADLTGFSLRPLANGQTTSEWRDHILFESEKGYGIQTQDYLYVLYDCGENRQQLYDLVADPDQTRNFAFDPNKDEVLKQHRHLLTQYAGKNNRQISFG